MGVSPYWTFELAHSSTQEAKKSHIALSGSATSTCVVLRSSGWWRNRFSVVTSCQGRGYNAPLTWCLIGRLKARQVVKARALLESRTHLAMIFAQTPRLRVWLDWHRQVASCTPPSNARTRVPQRRGRSGRSMCCRLVGPHRSRSADASAFVFIRSMPMKRPIFICKRAQKSHIFPVAHFGSKFFFQLFEKNSSTTTQPLISSPPPAELP